VIADNYEASLAVLEQIQRWPALWRTLPFHTAGRVVNTLLIEDSHTGKALMLHLQMLQQDLRNGLVTFEKRRESCQALSRRPLGTHKRQ
jgi:hypothetical protein